MNKCLLKIVVASVTTLMLLFTCSNVKASVINDNAGSYFSSYKHKEYTSILDVNDLKGTIWKLNYDAYRDLEYNLNAGNTYGLSYYTLDYTNNVLELPFIMQERNEYIREYYGYNFMPNAKINLVSGTEGKFLFYGKYLNQNNDPFCSMYVSYNLYANVDNKPIINFNTSYIGSIYSLAYENYQYYNSFTDIQFNFDYSDPNLFKIGSSNVYVFFPNNSKYFLEEFSDTQLETSVLEIFKKYCTEVSISDIDLDLASREYIYGLSVGYNDGYVAGLASGGNNDFRFGVLTGVINGVDDILNIEIFPNIKLRFFLLLPLTLGIVGMLFYFWRKD